MKLKNILTSAVFLLVLFAFGVGQFLLPDSEISVSERRKLSQAPELTAQTLLSGEYSEDLETYLLDQFPLRDELRRVKAMWQFDVYNQLDNNGIYIVDGSVCKLDKVLNQAQVNAAITNTNKVYETYLQGMNVHFALVPDKNYYAAETNGYPSMDYEQMEQLLSDGLDRDIQYHGFDICKDLTLSDYYSTDLHWRQEALESVVANLSAVMDFQMPDFDAFYQTAYTPFYGAYYGQSALNVDADTLITLSSAATDASIVTGAEFDGEKAVYDESDLDNVDLYDVFLSGAQAILTVTNPNGNTGRELIIFRDSFASSLAPLLLESYDTITLIDLRYVSKELLGQFVEFDDQDVLFLYNTGLVNSGMLLK